MDNFKPIIGITQGDPSGVGMELIIKVFSDENIFKYMHIRIHTPVPFDSKNNEITDSKSINEALKTLKKKDLVLHSLELK